MICQTKLPADYGKLYDNERKLEKQTGFERAFVLDSCEICVREVEIGLNKAQALNHSCNLSPCFDAFKYYE